MSGVGLISLVVDRSITFFKQSAFIEHDVAQQFSPEIWARIFRYVHITTGDMKVWNSMRNILAISREVVESIFLEDVLPKTAIKLELGENLEREDEHTDDEEIRTENDVSFVFSHVSEDKKTAFFQGPDMKKTLVTKLLKQYIKVPRNNFEIPRHTVRIRRVVNDTPIPGLQIFTKKPLLSCDWRGLYSAWFVEDENYRHMLADRVYEQDNQRERLNEQLKNGEVNQMEMLMRVAMGYLANTEQTSNAARRKRIRRQYKALDGRDWDGNSEESQYVEAMMRKRLKREENFYDDLEFSDDKIGKNLTMESFMQ